MLSRFPSLAPVVALSALLVGLFIGAMTVNL
jgi:hypothetical protein